MTQSSSLKPGTVVANRYKVLQVLGVGGMGTVYRALDQALEDTPVALKFLNPALVQDRGVFTRFRREVLLARKLAHPNIVKVYDIGSSGDHQYFISMEYVGGKSLRDKIQASPGRRLILPEALRILHEICHGVGHAHQSGIIHRDLKPDNILFDDDGVAKIADFGFAEATWKGSELTPVGETVGTPFYMAPEQIQGKPLDHRCDLYALGIIAYELLAGRRPFEEKSWFQLAQQHLQDSIPEVPDGGIPPWYMQIVRRATAKEPHDRFRTAEEMALAFAAPHASALQANVATQPVQLPDFSRYNRSNDTRFTLLLSAQQAMRRFSLKIFFATAAVVLVVSLLVAVIYSNRKIHEEVADTQESLQRRLASLGEKAFSPKSQDAIDQLFSAVSTEDTNLVASLLEREVDPNSRGLAGEYPLHIAARKGSIPMITLLLRYGAAPSPQNDAGETPLMLTIQGGATAAFDTLVSVDQLVNGKDRNGTSPLMLAVGAKTEHFVKPLLARGAIVNDRDFRGTPVIIHAVKSGSIGVVRSLLDAGASISVKDFDGKSPLDHSRDPAMLALLRGLR